jgi:cytochrome c-type biogenesis protein CcmH/NrfG
MLGDAYFDDSRLERAKEAYRQSVQIQPDYATGWYGLARVLARVGPKDEYELALQKLQQLRPEITKPAEAAPRP